MDKVASQALAAKWKAAIQLGIEAKKDFQADADECMRFFNGPYTFMYGVKESTPQRGDFAFVGGKGVPRPQIMMTVNKVAELVQLFGPSLYNQNPFRTCTPTELPDIPMQLFGNPQDPMTAMMIQPVMQQMSQWQVTQKSRAVLMQSMLNYFPGASDLEGEMREAVNESLITGLALMWTEVYRPIGAKHKLIGSFFSSAKNYVKDPDAEKQEDVKWIARRFVKPVWEFEAKFGLRPESVQGNRNSHSMGAATSTSTADESRRKAGKTNDLIVYWQIWSKMGLGGLLREIDPKVKEADRYGQYVTMIVAEDCEYLVNLPEEIWGNEQEMYRRAQWETPQWADDAWPCEELYYHKKSDSIWPISHLSPGLGELKFINWAFSFMASKMYRASKDFIAIPKSIGEELKAKIVSGEDYEILEIEITHGQTIKDIVSFMQHPEFQADFWTVISHVMEMFERRTGLSELMYGASEHQYRSAAEADVKSSQTSIRPDDMAKKVEKFSGKIGTREAIAARWHLTGQDVGVVFGPIIGGLWDRLVATADLSKIIHQLQFSVAAGSARKRNKQKDEKDADTLITNFLQLFMQAFKLTGDPKQLNALIELWGKANDRDVTDLLFSAPLPPPPMPGGAPGGAPPQGGTPPPAV